MYKSILWDNDGDDCDDGLIPILLYFIGTNNYHNADYKKAILFFEKLLSITDDNEANQGDNDDWYLRITTYLFLSYKHTDKTFDVKEIHKYYEKEKEFEEYDSIILPFALYQLLEDTSYLETAYHQVQERADNLEPDVAAKFLSYPIPSAIVEEWEKVTTDKN